MASCLAFTTNSFFMSKRDYKTTIKIAKTSEGTEIAGLLFGIEDNHNNPIVFKIVTPKTNSKKTATSCILDRDYANTITRELEFNGLYHLGNWHKHLGYGGPSNGDDKEAKHYLEINHHKSKVHALIVDIQGFEFDIYIVSYVKNNDIIYKKQLNLTLISTKKLKKLAIKYLSTIDPIRKITEHLEGLLNRECLILNRSITNEFLIQIPINLDKQEKFIKEISGSNIKTEKEEGQLFIYISIPNYINYFADKQEKIFIGIASKDYSIDISFCRFQFKHLFNSSIIIDVIQRIIENSSKCIKMPLSQFLLKEIHVN